MDRNNLVPVHCYVCTNTQTNWSQLLLVTGMNRKLGMSDEWFCAGDSLVLTVIAQVWIRAPMFLLHNFYVIRFCAAHGIVITGLGFRTPNEQLSHEVMTCPHTVFHKVSQTGYETRSQG